MYKNILVLGLFFCIIIYGTIYIIITEGLFCPVLLIMLGFFVAWSYLLKVELYRAKYIFVDIENRKIILGTMFKGNFEYNFSQIYVVTRRNYGAEFEFDDGIKIEFNRYLVEIETTEKPRMQRNIEKDDLPGVYFDERL